MACEAQMDFFVDPKIDALARKVAVIKNIGFTKAVFTALLHELGREQILTVRSQRAVLPGTPRQMQPHEGEPIKKRLVTVCIRAPDVYPRRGLDGAFDR
jgi:hypothetical protein